MKSYKILCALALPLILIAGCNSNSTTDPNEPLPNFVFSESAKGTILEERRPIISAVNLQINNDQFSTVSFIHKESNVDLFELTSDQGDKLVLMLPDGTGQNTDCIIYYSSAKIDTFDCSKDHFSVSGDMSLLPNASSNKGDNIILEYHNDVLEIGESLGSTRLTYNSADNTIKTSFAFQQFYNDVLCQSGCDQDFYSTLGVSTYLALESIINENAIDGSFLVFDNPIAGSADDEINLYTGLLIRENNLSTKVSKDGSVFSGGTDLFAAGSIRILEVAQYKEDIALNKQIGVHSWSDGDNSASDYPYSHEMHRMQATYTTKMLGVNGIPFYLFTINAAPANGEHYMSRIELEKYALVTSFIM